VSAACAAVLAAGLFLAAATVSDPLQNLVWERRVLVVLAPTPDDARAAETRRRFDGRTCEAADRDLTMVLAPARGEGRIDERPLTRAEVDTLRARFRAGGKDFLVVLVGKDGGEKLRLAEPPALEQVFALIDGMPMRRAEMRAAESGCGG
jgi:hypothetical protein